jgi:lipopolysaccharide/colanic/teichoic acid biosynthesis glycosyltransferase
VKRVFDLFFGSLLILLALPLMGIIWILVKMDSPGPALLKQERVGENGEIFRMYKFRSMRTAGTQGGEAVTNPDNLHKIPDDPRVTSIGRILRRWSLDELPQFFNIMRGDMSLVGPRPELPWLVSKYQPWQRKRFAVPQGLTGWWQVNGRSTKPMHLNTEDDLYYIQNYSIWLDVRILWLTLFAVLRRDGAF